MLGAGGKAQNLEYTTELLLKTRESQLESRASMIWQAAASCRERKKGISHQ